MLWETRQKLRDYGLSANFAMFAFPSFSLIYWAWEPVVHAEPGFGWVEF